MVIKKQENVPHMRYRLVWKSIPVTEAAELPAVENIQTWEILFPFFIADFIK